MGIDFQKPFDSNKVDFRRALGPRGYTLSSLLEDYHNEFQSLNDRLHRVEAALCDLHEGNRIKLFGMSQPESLQRDSQECKAEFHCSVCRCANPQIHTH